MAPTRAVDRQLIPGGWKDHELRIGNRTLNLLVPGDPDAVLEKCEDVGGDPALMDPYWSRLWPTSVVMANFVAARSWPAQAALELGCGIGLVGIAGLMANLEVTFSDYIPLAVDLAVHNAIRNGFDRAHGRVFDWRAPPDNTFPLILASDVLYDPKLHPDLWNVIENMLDAGGICWIGDPGRYHASTFLKQAHDQRWRVSLYDQYGESISVLPAGEFSFIEMQKPN